VPTLSCLCKIVMFSSKLPCQQISVRYLSPETTQQQGCVGGQGGAPVAEAEALHEHLFRLSEAVDSTCDACASVSAAMYVLPCSMHAALERVLSLSALPCLPAAWISCAGSRHGSIR
jgi:hypothetical protein